MPRYEVEADGRRFEVEAPNMAKAQGMARLYIARNRMTRQAEAGAEGRSRAQNFPPLESTGSTFADSAYAGMGYPSATNLPDAGQNLATAGAIMAAAPMVGGMVAAPVATGKALLGGLAGGAAGKEAGEWVGRNVPLIGGKTAEKVLGAAGGLIGGGAGATIAPRVGAGNLLRMATGGRLGMLTEALGGTEAAAARTIAAEAASAKVATSAAKEEVAKLRAELLKARIGKTTAATEAIKKRTGEAMRKLAVAEQREARLAAKAAKMGVGPAQAPRPAEPEFIPDEAVSVVPERAPILPAGQRAMPTNLGGKAKPGPAPTPPDQLEEALRRSIEAAKAQRPAPPLQGPRVQIGAERVGKPIGMTKEEVRVATGPILGERLGEASPIIPREPWERIVETMKALPKTGGEREAYVMRAAPGKNRGQMEQLRRTLEQLGLLLPIGAGGVALTHDAEAQ